MATLWLVVSWRAAAHAQADPVVEADTTQTDSTQAPGGSSLTNMARFRGQGGVAQLPDSLSTSNVGIRFMPTYLNQITGDVSSVGMKNSFTTNVATPFGSTFNFLISTNERHYRLNTNFDENKQMSATMLHTFDIFTTGSVSFLDSRSLNRTTIPGGQFQDYIINDKSINVGGAYRRALHSHTRLLESINLDAMASGAAVQGERTYKDDQTLAAGGFGGVATNFRPWLFRIDGRGGHRETWDRSTTSLAVYDGLGSNEDSLSTGLVTELGDSIFVHADYIYYESERTWADQAQGSLGGQQSGVQNVFIETEHRNTRATIVALNAKVLRKLNLEITGAHDSQLLDYAVQQTRYSNTVGNALKGTVNYTTPWKTLATVALENSKTLRDFGPLSVSSYNDIRKKATLSLNHSITPTFGVALFGSTMLTRTEYLDTEANPRDRDQIDSNASVRLNSSPFKKVTASINLTYSMTDVINIDASQSQNNRTRTLYELRPAFTYTVSKMFTITQNYGVAIEYTDFVNKPTDNFLDRNLTFSNVFDFRPTGKVGFGFRYDYNFHDNGSYLPDEATGQDLLTVQGEDVRDRILLRLDYHVNEHLTVFGEDRYNRFEDRDVFSDVSTVSADGQITVGSRGEYQWGQNRTLRFSLARVKRFSAFGSEAEKNFWDMQSEFNYPF